MKYIPLGCVAKKYNKTTTQVMYAIKQQRLPGTKIGWCWFCDETLLPDTWPPTPRSLKKTRGGKEVE